MISSKLADSTALADPKWFSNALFLLEPTPCICSNSDLLILFFLFALCVLIANLFCKPAARKLEQQYSIIKYRDMILNEGISMLPNKPHPYIVQDHLNRFLDASNHFDIADK